jgi:hypothetical protein
VASDKARPVCPLVESPGYAKRALSKPESMMRQQFLAQLFRASSSLWEDVGKPSAKMVSSCIKVGPRMWQGVREHLDGYQASIATSYEQLPNVVKRGLIGLVMTSDATDSLHSTPL